MTLFRSTTNSKYVFYVYFYPLLDYFYLLEMMGYIKTIDSSMIQTNDYFILVTKNIYEWVCYEYSTHQKNFPTNLSMLEFMELSIDTDTLPFGTLYSMYQKVNREYDDIIYHDSDFIQNLQMYFKEELPKLHYSIQSSNSINDMPIELVDLIHQYLSYDFILSNQSMITDSS